MSEFSFEKIVSHVTSRGFVFQGSEIYGGLSNTWDYGPLGVELKNNIKKAWLKKFVQESPMNVGLDSAILMNPNVWVATGHLSNFTDPLIDCKHCHHRFRADKLIEEYDPNVSCEAWTNEELMAFIREKGIACPDCGSTDFTDIRKFQLMFKTFQGVTEDSKSTVYLRPETAQGIFVNFKNIQRTTRKKLPFGVCQVGKAFRNEITPGNFIFRIREFEQMEMEFFCKPGEDLKWFNYWKDYMKQFLLGLNIQEQNLRFRDHAKEELSFYSKATTDVEYKFPFGWGELWGIADRTDYDLTCHMKQSSKDLTYFDSETNERYTPYVVEPSLGCDRLILASMCDAYTEEEVKPGDTRIVMKLHPFLAPYKAAVMPLSKQQCANAMGVFEKLSKHFMITYDDTGSIGKRYRRQDEIGTPFCITYDFDSDNDKCVTIRERDSMNQVRVPIDELDSYLARALEY